jgi:hypothetical protein
MTTIARGFVTAEQYHAALAQLEAQTGELKSARELLDQLTHASQLLDDLRQAPVLLEQIRGQLDQTVTARNGALAALDDSRAQLEQATAETLAAIPEPMLFEAPAPAPMLAPAPTAAVTITPPGDPTRTAFSDQVSSAVPTNGYRGDRTGTVDNGPILAGLTSPVYMQPGTYAVNTNTTVPVTLTFAPGAILKPASGVTVTLAQGVQAGAYQWIDMSLGGVVRIPVGDAHAHWWGAWPNTDSTTALQWAATSLAYQTSTDAHCRTLQFEDGLYKVSAALTYSSPIKWRGRSSRGTIVQITDTFPAGGILVTWTNVGASADLLWEESHLPAGGMESICLDGNGRSVQAHVWRFQKVDRMQFLDVMVRNFNGSVVTGSSFRESQFVQVRTWVCGSPSSPYAPVVDLFDDGTGGADGHNLITFNSCQFALSAGDHVRYGTDTSTIVVRGLWFHECVFHGLADTLQTYTDNYGHNGNQILPFVDGAQQCRHVCVNARNVFYTGCRFILPGRGQPVFHMQPSTVLGAGTVNNVLVGPSNVFTARAACSPLTLATVNTGASTMTVAGVTLPNSTVVAPHYLQTGARVQFNPGIGGTLPAPLVAATDYFAIVVDPQTFQVSATRGGAAITLTSTGTAPITVSQQDIVYTASGSTLGAPNHRLSTGARVQVATAGVLPAPLAAATDYFAIRVDNANVQLASSRANADAGTAITLTTAGTGIQWLNPVHFFFNVEQGVLGVGSPQQLEGTPTRAWARVETSGALRWDWAATQWGTAQGPPAELATGQFSTYLKGGLVLLDNNTSYWGTRADGVTAVQLAYVTAGDGTSLGNAAINTTVTGATIVDLVGGGARGVRVQNGSVGFNGAAAVVKPTLSGSRGGNAALASLITAMANVGLVTDGTTA